jgi:LacI family transcriptional regulator
MEKMNMIKLAKELNLSIATVSKALKDSTEINIITKQRVKDLAEKYQYKPNQLGINLRSGSSKSIAVVIPEITNNFFSLVVDAVQTVAQIHNFDLFIYVTHDIFENEITVLKNLSGNRVQGIIMSLTSQTQIFSHIKDFYDQNHLPIIFFDRIPDLNFLPRIVTNNYQSAFQATEHLIQQGSKKIAFIYDSEWSYISKERKKGFESAISNSNLTLYEDFIIRCTEDTDINYSIIYSILSSSDRPDAICSSIEKLALVVYRVAKDLAINIPDQLKLISFSNLRAASLLDPSLSTISQPAFEIGRQSADLLFKMIALPEARNLNDFIVINSELVVRDSTKQILPTI